MRLLREELQKNMLRIVSGYTNKEIVYPFYTIGRTIGTHGAAPGYDGDPLFDTFEEAMEERKKKLKRWNRPDTSAEPFILGVTWIGSTFVLDDRW